jgi:predicted  nucleic acid-binding Zn-ribbon protein
MKYEELKQEIKCLKQTTGLSIMVLENQVAQLQDQLDEIFEERARLVEEMRRMQEQFGVSKVDLSQNTIIDFLAYFPEANKVFL